MTVRELARTIERMKPGERYRVSRLTLGFPVCDVVLENIIGSSYEFGYDVDLITADVVYFRMAAPLTDGRRSYVSPDVRQRFRQRHDGTYEPINA